MKKLNEEKVDEYKGYSFYWVNGVIEIWKDGKKQMEVESPKAAKEWVDDELYEPKMKEDIVMTKNIKKILEGADIRQTIVEASEYATQNKNLKVALASFPKKCNELWDYLGDIHDIAMNLKKEGRDFVDEYNPGEKDRNYMNWILQQAKKLQDYYNIKISPRLDKWLKDNNLTIKDLYENFELGAMLKQYLETLEVLCGIDMETIDLDKLARMF